MNASLKFLTSITFITLAACSTQETKQDATTANSYTAAPADKSPAMANEAGPPHRCDAQNFRGVQQESSRKPAKAPSATQDLFERSPFDLRVFGFLGG